MDAAAQPAAAPAAPESTSGAAPSRPDPLTANFDSLGRPFDDGKFKRGFDSLGRWKNLRGGRKPGSPTAPSSAPAGAPPSSSDAPNFDDVARAAAGGEPKFAEIEVENVTAESLIGVCQVALMLIGGDEGVLTDLEKKMLRRPLQRVLDKYEVGADSLPPEAELAFCVATLVIARLQKPKTASWFAKVKAWAVDLWFNREGRKIAADVREAVRP